MKNAFDEGLTRRSRVVTFIGWIKEASRRSRIDFRKSNRGSASIISQALTFTVTLQLLPSYTIASQWPPIGRADPPPPASGMHNIANKARMAQVLERMRRNFPEQYNFYPRTWVLPGEMSGFSAQFDERGSSQHCFIIKPDAGAKGRGIFLTSKLENVTSIMQKELLVAQRYLPPSPPRTQ